MLDKSMKRLESISSRVGDGSITANQVESAISKEWDEIWKARQIINRMACDIMEANDAQ
jgi:hypothetical protein